MKITHRKIVASTQQPAVIPTEFAPYFEMISRNDQFEETFGYPAHPTPCEEAVGYDIKSLGYAVAKSEYAEAFRDAGVDVVELVSEAGGEPFLAYVVHDIVYALSMSDLPLDDDYDDYDDYGSDVEASIDTGLDYWYYTSHGLGPGTIPSGVTVLDTVEEGYKTWMLLDKMLNTEELEYYDLKEQTPPEGSVTHNGDVIEGCNVTASKCVKIDEDESKIHYRVDSSEAVEGMSLVNYNGYTIRSNPQRGGYDVIDPFGKLAKSGALTERDARNYIDSIGDDIFGAEEVDDVEDGEIDIVENDDDFETLPEQEYKSAGTAVNGKQGKLPAVFKKADIPSGALVLDYGGGTVESEAVAQAYLGQFNAVEMLYDPFNQPAEHNNDIIKALRQAGGADVAICSNVLNVVKEPEVRLDIIRKIKKLLKQGAIAYFSVYEGSGKGEGSHTQKGQSYQNNMKLESYLEEIATEFPESYRKGSVIIAPKTSAKGVAASTDISSIDTDQLEKEINAAAINYLTSPEVGFDAPGSTGPYSMPADEMYVLEIHRNDDNIVVEVRAELSYDSLIGLANALTPVVGAYDEDAYFDIDEPGITSAIIWDKSAEWATIQDSSMPEADAIEGASNPEDAYVDPEYPEDIKASFDFEYTLEVTDTQDIAYIEGDPSEDFGLDVDLADADEPPITEGEIMNCFLQLVAWNMPSDPGKYFVKGHAEMLFVDSKEGYYNCDWGASKITQFDITKVGKVESSTAVEAAMTEDEVRYAIENGKPFDLASFRKYFGNSPAEGAVKAEDIKEGDMFVNTEDASMVDLGAILKVISINDPRTSWPGGADYTFDCKVIDDPSGRLNSENITVWYDKDDFVGPLVQE